ncbi:MAG: inositol-3-phosphate synthase [Candidatus Aenigmarchaeota archaeon]|nr:inositol-3-phosphate synthase [Candidatus Aenigmarchaeota archaeon]
MRVNIFGQGYVSSIFAIGLQRLKNGEIGYEGVPLGNDLPYSIDDIEVVGAFDIDPSKVGKNLSKVVKQYWEKPIDFDINYRIKKGYEDKRKDPEGVELKDEIERLVREYERTEPNIFINTINTEYARPFNDSAKFISAIENNEVKRVSPAQLYFYSVTDYVANQDEPSAFINAIPTPLANDPAAVDLAEESEVVLFGDDGASGATPLTSDILEHLKERRRKVRSIAQFNIGGNTDFLSLTDPKRNKAKEITKSSIVEDVLGYDSPHYIKPTGYLEPLGDKKFIAMHIPYQSFNEAEDELVLTGRINDSPALAGLLVDLVRLGQMAMDRKEYGTIYPVNAFYMKRPGPKEGKSIAKFHASGLLKDWIDQKE